jgi:hypothetical protein
MRLLELCKRYLEATNDPAAAATLAVGERMASTLLSVDDVASELGVSPDKVRSWCRTRQLLAADVNDANRPHWAIRRVDLDALLQSRQPTPPASRSKRTQRLTAGDWGQTNPKSTRFS